MTGVTKLNKVALRAEIAAILEAERAEKAADELVDASLAECQPAGLPDSIESLTHAPGAANDR